MTTFKSELRAVLVGAVVIAVASLASNQLPESPRPNRQLESGAEVDRLKQHFRVVEAELLARDVSHLSEAQRAARARHIVALRQYREAGAFPHNHVVARRIPFFRDDHGTLCALAYLIAQSGETELVDRVAQRDNNADVRDLTEDPELLAWLDVNGLTVEEAARIQPSYAWDEPHEERPYLEPDAESLPREATTSANTSI